MTVMQARKRRLPLARLVCLALAASAASVWAAATPAQKCAADKMEAAGKHAECRHEAEARNALRPDQTKLKNDLDRCAATQERTWTRIEAQAGGACPTNDDQEDVEEMSASETSAAAGAIAGSLPLSGFWSIPLETGQTACWTGGGVTVPCAGTGQDGAEQRGMKRRYADNGDGTITDEKTGLTWEKESDDGSIHDGDTVGDWNHALTKIALLNVTAFAGHTDWRLPNVFELQSLADYGVQNPAVSAAFNTGCTPGCTVLTCSCTRNWPYWTSTTAFDLQTFGWAVSFRDGLTHTQRKSNSIPARAVRGGL